MLSISNAGQYQSLASGLLSGFDQQVKALKAYLRPNPSGIFHKFLHKYIIAKNIYYISISIYLIYNILSINQRLYNIY